MSKPKTRTIKVDDLARVEGEGALYLRVRGDEIQDLKFRIHEPPRFFEALLQGRAYSEAPDITARICGICPIAYIMGATHAIEDALGVSVDRPMHDLRRLVYCGEWIESHVLHAFLLHAPDFLGYEAEQVDHLFRRAGEFLTQPFVLGAHADRASIRMALAHHDAAHRD